MHNSVCQKRPRIHGRKGSRKLGLNSPVETQALFGTRVTIDEQVVVNGLLWVHAWVDGQPTPRDTNHYGGYPGWIPDQHLTAQPPPEPVGGTARVTGSAPAQVTTPKVASPRGRTTPPRPPRPEAPPDA